MVNNEIRLIIFFAAIDGEALSVQGSGPGGATPCPRSGGCAGAGGPRGEALYSQQKQDQELTVAQITKSLLPNSD